MSSLKHMRCISWSPPHHMSKNTQAHTHEHAHIHTYEHTQPPNVLLFHCQGSCQHNYKLYSMYTHI